MLKGLISTIDNNAKMARVILIDRYSIVTPEIPVAAHVGNLNVGDKVAVCLFSEHLANGLVVARWPS